MPSTEAHHISKELLGVFAHLGSPEEILSDQETNSVHTLLEESLIYAADKVDLDLSLSSLDRWLAREVQEVQRHSQDDPEEVCEQEPGGQ